MRHLLLLVLALFAFCHPALAQNEPDDPQPKVTSREAKIGPIEFHVVPEIGVGVFLEDDQVVSFGGNDSYFIFRIPGLQFPGMNNTAAGVQVELSDAPPGSKGVKYDLVSYVRTKIAGPAFTGANIRIVRGGSELGAAIDARVMPVVGLRMWTIGGHVPFSLEVEFLDNNRPVKASLIITWE